MRNKIEDDISPDSLGVDHVLKTLQIEAVNAGVYADEPLKTADERNDKKKRIASINPATGQVIARVSLGTSEEYETFIQYALSIQSLWACYPAPKRGEIIRQIGIQLRVYKEALATLISIEMGKTLEEARGEVQEMIDTADFATGLSRMLYGLNMPSERNNHRLLEQWHPYGLMLVISAFNFPMAVWAWNAFIGAVCGNIVIWKPSSQTPLCAIALYHICQSVFKANALPTVFTIFLPETSALLNQMVKDKRLPLVCFTGSTPVGRLVGMQVAERLGRSILELGGNNAVIVTESANLKLAIPSILFGAIGTSGQRCTTTRRVLIQKKRFQQVVDILSKAYHQIRIGNPLVEGILMGPLVSKRATAAFSQTVRQLKEANAQILCGGELIKGTGFYVEPTLVTGIAPTHDIVQRETFAPILYLFPYHDFHEAIQAQNAVTQGLSSSIFTDSLQEAEYFISAMGSDCGIANINSGTSGAEIGGAFGGEKETGGGRESGSDAWKGYMRRQTTTMNWGDNLPLAQGIRFDV